LTAATIEVALRLYKTDFIEPLGIWLAPSAVMYLWMSWFARRSRVPRRRIFRIYSDQGNSEK
jgi:hypothetical protein